MLFEIEHRTHYAYAERVGSAGQYIRMTPSSGRVQTVHSWKLQASGALFAWHDGHGNLCHHRTIQGSQSELNLLAHGVVETHEHDGFNTEDGMGIAPPAAYCKSTDYTKADETVRAFAQSHAAELAAAGPDSLLVLMHAIREAVDYRTDTTHVGTTASEALVRREGVCQDHAHVLIALCRHAGIPARYVSGYLWTGEEHESHAASHAWAEVHVPTRGWLNLDVANDCIADARYIRLAAGLDYGDAGPLRGLRGGGGEETMDISVTLDVLPPGQFTRKRQHGAAGGSGQTQTQQMQQGTDPYGRIPGD